MHDESEEGFSDLAVAIQALRAQLLEAQEAGRDHAVSFGVGRVEVEFTVESKTTGTAGAGVKFWVVNADGKVDHTHGSAHKLKVELLPTGPDGQQLKVASSSDDGPPSK